MDDTKETASGGVKGRASDRRTQPRYRFTATAELVEEKSGTRVEARIADISQRGCYAETSSPFPLGTSMNLQISKGADSLAASARVVYSSVKGMGLAFSDVTEEQVQTLEKWLGPLRERDWLSRNRRRTQRVMMQVAVRVSGQNTAGSRFDEQACTLAINTHGASILLSAPVRNGQGIELLNMATGDKAECVVAYLGQRQGDRTEVGVEFILPNPKFWHVAFPPKDWTQPISDF